MKAKLNTLLAPVLALSLLLVLSGCPTTPIPDGGGNDQAEYDAGFDAGFAEDDEYWLGFYDSYDTIDFGPIYYSGSDIPYLESPPYDAGYWDGVWYAYNDGYFVEYDYAFTIGFSEGYDLAYSADWPAFLAGDVHTEYLDGGFSDGYNDGFSEGRIFGAWDYENLWAFDWLNAMWDYRDGTDLTIGGISTGNAGPVYLYEYGTDPNDLILKSRSKDKSTERKPLAIRHGLDKDVPALSYRPLIASAQQEFNVLPALSPRSTTPLLLQTTWLQRIDAYLNSAKSINKAKHVSRAASIP